MEWDIRRRARAPQKYRSIFISDVHLGFRGCRAVPPRLPPLHRVQRGPWLTKLGARAYDRPLARNGLVCRVRRHLGLKRWSLAGYLKHRVKNAVSYIGNFQHAVAL